MKKRRKKNAEQRKALEEVKKKQKLQSEIVIKPPKQVKSVKGVLEKERKK
jgi:hypothetical protein